MMKTETGPAVTLNWRPNSPDVELFDGDRYLVAHEVHDSRTDSTCWDYAVVTIAIDEDDGVAELLTGDGDDFGWTWPDVDWYVPVEELAPTREGGE
ncbi:MAG TPA: hypothetical protein VKA15_25320 [Isosphaeraceae bacterium]|nr:hypothetical protein [Isosphaeraceae bacterium]